VTGEGLLDAAVLASYLETHVAGFHGLRQHDRIQVPAGALHDLDHVIVAPGGPDVVDADAADLAAPVEAVERSHHGLPGNRLLRWRNGVLQVAEHVIRCRRRRFGEHLLADARDGELAAAKAFGSSAFGPLHFRVVADGVDGDWQPLGTLVRLPTFDSLKCDVDPDVACKLRGSNLFLVDSIAQNQQFTNPVQVPDGFPGRVLPVPHPMDGGELYVKLRDDPSVVNVVTLTAEISGGKKPTEKQEAAAAKPRPAYAAPAEPATNGAVVAPAKVAPAPGSDASKPESATPATHAAAPSASDALKPVSTSHPAVDPSRPVASPASAPVSSSDPEQKPATTSSSASAQK